MRKSLLKLLGISLALALSTTVFAVGMGGIRVGSGLGQQLNADIELLSVGKTEKTSLVARLAPPEAYKDAGLTYPYGNKFKFQIESRANGEPYLKVSSELPINDPFVIMLVELTWSSGKLLREYTFLLDPPGYVPEQPAQAAVQAVAPAIQSMPEVAPVTPAEQASPGEQIVSVAPIVPFGQTAPSEVAPAQMELQAASAPAPMEQQAASAPVAQPDQVTLPPRQAFPLDVEALPELDEWVLIKRGDTMREVADQYRREDMSLDRMLVALYRANANKFDGKNMNRIKAGKIVRLPHQSEIEAVSQSDAIREIRAQAADWNAYRQKLASTASIRNQSQEAQQIASGRISSSIADKMPVAKESAKEVLKLSKGEAPGDGMATGAGGKPGTVQDQKNAAQEEAIAKDKALKEEQARVAMLEKQLKDLQKLAEMKSALPKVKTEAAALVQPPTVAASAVAAASGVAMPAVQPKPIPKPLPKPIPKPKAKVVEPEPLIDQILAEPLYLAGGVLLLVVLGGAGFVLARRKKKIGNDKVREEPSIVDDSAVASAVTAGRIAEPAVSSPDTGDFTKMGATDEAATQSENNIDPIGEADLFLNFGRDAQAEEILKEALQTTPNDHRIHLKLLGIYSNRVDASSFADIASQLKDSGDEDAWQQALAMGRKLDPNNTLFGGTGASMESTASATTAFDATQLFAQENAPTEPVLDFDIDSGSSSAKGASSQEQDFLGNADQEATMAFEVVAGGQAPEIDLNVAAETGESPQPGAALTDSGDMIFDVGSSFMPEPAKQPEAAKPIEAGDGGMEFTLDFPIGTPAEEPVEKPAEKAAPEAPAGIGLAGINLNFDEPIAVPESTAGGKDEHWQEIATKLDLAKAYQEMGDASGARDILEEVLRDGDAGQREAAQTLIDQLG